ncbi:protein kinase domain containing protein, partial [Acanthamoeba castellanii str. Neff]
VRLMTTLRHPNVVLFMAASTKAPRMCIVMEYMSLGSLYELLHNELIGKIPFELKAKMAYQGAKGMHFLHSSGIVHRDLKSLNLLLDSKWNVKVSDFGLTKFKEDMEKHRPNRSECGLAGSIHWTAPELINQSPCVDLALADVYSFGVILWELLTRQQPYAGMRDGLRPRMPDNVEELCTLEYAELIAACWHQDPAVRPPFIEIMSSLSAMFECGDSSGSRSSGQPSDMSSCAVQASSGIFDDDDDDADDVDNDDNDVYDVDEQDDAEAGVVNVDSRPPQEAAVTKARSRVAAEQLRVLSEGDWPEEGKGATTTKKSKRKMKGKGETKKKKKNESQGRAAQHLVSPPEGPDVTI